MTINIEETLLDYANELATADNVSLEVWCERKINGFLRRQLKDSLIEKINTTKLEQIPIYITAVESAKAGITAAEIENAAKIEVLEPEIPEEEATSTPK